MMGNVWERKDCKRLFQELRDSNSLALIPNLMHNETKEQSHYTKSKDL